MKNQIKIRKIWLIKPETKVHSSPKGKQAYSRSENRRMEQNYKMGIYEDE